MVEIRIKDDFIKLGQAMKLGGAVDSGVEAKMVISEGEVKVNGEICLMRGKKLYKDDSFLYKNEEYKIIK